MRTSHFSFPITLAQDAVGFSWNGVQLNPRKYPKFTIEGPTLLQIDGKEEIQVDRTDDLILVEPMIQTKRQTLVQFDEPCLRVKALTVKDSVKKASYLMGIGSGGFGAEGLGGMMSSTTHLKKGVKLKWQSGRSAGHVIDEYVLSQGRLVPHDHNQACFKIPLAFGFVRPDSPKPLMVCVRKEDIKTSGK